MNPTELLAIGIGSGFVLGLAGGYILGWHSKRFDAERKLELWQDVEIEKQKAPVRYEERMLK